MSDGLDNARELLEIDTNEVSLVDRAANRRKFLLIKREGSMGSTDDGNGDVLEFSSEHEVLAHLEVLKDLGYTVEIVLKAGDLPTDLRDAARFTLQWMRNTLGKSTGAPKKSLESVWTFLNKVVTGKFSTEKQALPDDLVNAMSDTLAFARKNMPDDGTAKGQVTKVLSFLSKVVGSTKPTAVAKAADAKRYTEVVEKAKRMTPGRLKKLRESLESLTSLLKDLEESKMNDTTDHVSDSSFAQSLQKALGLGDEEEPKTQAEAIAKAFGDALDKKLDPLTTRLDALEKAKKAGPFGAEEEEGEEEDEEKKKAKAKAKKAKGKDGDDEEDVESKKGKGKKAKGDDDEDELTKLRKRLDAIDGVDTKAAEDAQVTELAEVRKRLDALEGTGTDESGNTTVKKNQGTFWQGANILG